METPKAQALGTHEVEVMDSPAWKQTLKDVPVAVLGGTLGYGVGKTVAEYYVRNHLAAGKPIPGWLPAVPAFTTAAHAILASRLQGIMKERRAVARDEAERRGKKS